MPQTAVDYFKDELVKKGFFVPKEIYTKAQEVFQEQIMDAYNNGENRSAELYYNETHNK